MPTQTLGEVRHLQAYTNLEKVAQMHSASLGSKRAALELLGRALHYEEASASLACVFTDDPRENGSSRHQNRREGLCTFADLARNTTQVALL